MTEHAAQFCPVHRNSMLVRETAGNVVTMRCTVCHPSGEHVARLTGMLAEFRAAQVPKTYRVEYRHGRRFAIGAPA